MNRLLDRIPAPLTHRREPLGLYNKYATDWNTKLSFESLKEKGLVNCYEEWRSLKTAFYYKHVGSDNICKWLNNQKGHFRVSYLSHILIAGYGRPTDVGFDIENLIAFYCNIIFIKLYDSSNSDIYQLRAFNANMTINNLIRILEIDDAGNLVKYQNYKRIWSRFGAVKFVYSLQKNDKKICTDYEYTKNDNRWVEIPYDLCSTLTVKDIDNKLEFHQILEFGVDTLNKTYFDRNVMAENYFIKNDTNYNNRFEWLCSLEIGDMVNVCKQYGVWMEAYIKYRDYDTFYLQCIGFNGLKGSEEEVKSVGADLDRLQKRYAFCKWSGCSNAKKSNTLVFCDWITAFAGNSMRCPIVFE